MADTPSLADRLFALAAEVWPRRAPDDDADDGVLADVSSWATRALGEWVARRASGSGGLDVGVDRLAAVGHRIELASRVEAGTAPGLEVFFAVDGAEVGVGRTSDLPAAVCTFVPTAPGLFEITATLATTDDEPPPQTSAWLQVVDDAPTVVLDTRLLDGDLGLVAAAIAGLTTRGVALCWAELAEPGRVPDRRRQLVAAGLPPAAILAVAERAADFETLGVDFGLVNARLLVRRIRAGGVPLVAAVTEATATDGAAAVGLPALPLAELTARLAAGDALPELRAAAAEFCAARAAARGPDALHRRLDLMTATAAVDGHAVELELDNRRARAALLADLDGARRRIDLQFYILKPGRFARELSERLRARAAAGVEVRLVVDALYSGHDVLGRTNPVIAELTDVPGIAIVASDPVTLGGVDSVALKHRDHRKLVIIDDEIAYVTGRNGADEYYLGFDEVDIDDTTPHDAIPWLDAHARLRGPLVGELAALFAANWRRNGGAMSPDSERPAPAPAGSVRARVIQHDGLDDVAALASYDAMFAGARDRIIVVNDFPVIADLALRLCAAAQRGVVVDILTGSAVARRGDGSFFDGPRHRELFEYLVKRCYEALLAAGVRVWEVTAPPSPRHTARGGAIRPYVHAKVVVVDGAIASVGSANLDATASHWEREVNLILEDAAVARDLTARLDALLATAHRIDPDSADWRREAPRRALAARLWPERLYS